MVGIYLITIYYYYTTDFQAYSLTIWSDLITQSNTYEMVSLNTVHNDSNLRDIVMASLSVVLVIGKWFKMTRHCCKDSHTEWFHRQY